MEDKNKQLFYKIVKEYTAKYDFFLYYEFPLYISNWNKFYVHSLQFRGYMQSCWKGDESSKIRL